MCVCVCVCVSVPSLPACVRACVRPTCMPSLTSRKTTRGEAIIPSLPVSPLDSPPHPRDHYFTALSWVDNEEVSVVWMNRAQNISVITICSPPLYFCETVSALYPPESLLSFCSILSSHLTISLTSNPHRSSKPNP